MHIGFDRYRGEGPATGNAVPVGVESDRLIFVDLGRSRDKGIEGMRRQRHRGLFVLLEQLPDRLGLTGHSVVQLGQRTLSQIGIQFRHVLHRRDRRGPIPLQIVDAVLDVGFFVAPRRHTETGIEAIMTGQRFVPRMKLALSSLQNRRGHCLGIIPPHLQRNAAKEGKALDHPGQDRLGPLARQCHGETKARVTPGEDQDRDLPTPIWKINVDVSEISLQTTARWMRQGNERLASVPTVLAYVTADLVIATHIALFITQTPIELGRRVTLFTWGLLIIGQDLIDQPLVGAQTRSRAILEQRVGTRFALLEHLANLSSRMTIPSGDLPNAHPIPMSDPDPAILFHRQHPFSPLNWKALSKKPPAYGVCYGGSILSADFYYQGGSLLHADFQPMSRRYAS